MQKIYNSVEDLIGNTPLLRLHKIEEYFNLEASLYAKLENFNPAGSAKDRAALFMIKEAVKRGELKTGASVIVPTSGNTGIGLALIGTLLGYKVLVVMPENMSEERKKMIKAYGGNVVLSPAGEGMTGSIKLSEKLKSENPGSIIIDQFSNMDNSLSHYKTTGPEIYEALDGNVNAFVAGVGTGGTISGVARYLKEKNNNIQIIAVEPEKSPVLSKGVAGSHGIQGIGANFVPEVLENDLLDKVFCISDEDSYYYGNLLGKVEGVFVGISSGAALAGAIKYARENPHKIIVVLFPDSGDRYLSTTLFQ